VKKLGVSSRELACLVGVVILGALLRFANLPVRGGWDSDQGTEMLALRDAISNGRLPTFGPTAISVATPFHHGALYYDLLLPAAWLGNGDPTWVVGEIALLSLLVIPVTWWIARSIGGVPAGLIAAMLAATSAALVGYATFIWNPTLVEPGAALALLGAWQAIRTRRPAWWVVAAAGAAVAVQAHIAAAVILVPLALTFIYDIRRGPRPARSRTARWGLAGAGLFILTYLPFIVSELGDGFADTRSMLAYFTTDSNSAASVAPPLRLLVAAIRIPAWPLTRWPIVGLKTYFGIAFLVASAFAIGLVWRLGATSRPTEAKPADSSPDDLQPADSPPDDSSPHERGGTRLIACWLLAVIVILGLGLHAVSEFQALPTEQYHVVADPLVLVATGLITGGLWRSQARRWATIAGRAAAVAVVASIVAWNLGQMPPLTSQDGGWPAAQAAAARLERDTDQSQLALVSLWRDALGPNKGTDAYAYPLQRDGVVLVDPADTRYVVLLCDMFWLGWVGGCSGPAQAQWLAEWQATEPAGSGLTLIDSFSAAPDRILIVYRRGP
jgi:4-amino-4-deoxy-L-arabinose transferase-like glycosyltransferase